MKFKYYDMEERYFAHKHLFGENKVHDKICHNFMNIDETVEHMNNQYWKYKQLKQKIKSITEILNEDIGYVESFKKIEEVLK